MSNETKPARPPLSLGLILLLGMTLWSVLWFSPASLLTVIRASFGVSQASAGFLMSVICLVASLFGPFSGYILVRWGIRKDFLISMAFLALGSIGTLLATHYSLFVICRLLIGIGFGLSLSLAASAIMQWFSPGLRPYLNTLYAILPYLATALNFLLTVKLYDAVDEDWRLTLAMPGFLILALIGLWLLFDRQPPRQEAPQQAVHTPFLRVALDLLRDREVRLICLADFCDMWGFQFLSSFLVTYLVQYTGCSEDAASTLTSIFPIAGIVGGLLFGYIMSKVGLRKPFTWPMHLMILAGTLLIVLGEGTVQIVGIAAAGLGNAAWAPALFTMPMEFEGMASDRVSVLFSLMLTVGYFASFLSPVVGGLIADTWGLKYAFIVFAGFAAVAAVATFLMKETGPARRRP